MPAGADDALLFANRVEKTYPNGTVALERVKLAIRPGDFVSLLGPSGCGKSTLLKLFAGLETPSAGHLRWWGGPAIGVGTARGPARDGGRTMAMVFREATLMPWAKVAANVRLPLDGAHAARRQRRTRAARAGTGRAGALRRILSARAVGRHADARVDRPRACHRSRPAADGRAFGALDEFTRNKLDADLRALWAERGLTVVFVTHSIYEAVYLSTRVVVMAARPPRDRRRADRSAGAARRSLPRLARLRAVLQPVVDTAGRGQRRRRRCRPAVLNRCPIPRRRTS